MATAFLFPGQGAQSVGMLGQLAAEHPAIAETFAEASSALAMDLWALVANGPAAELNRTENTQPALLTASVALYRAWRAAGGAAPEYLAGHSLGEYSALVCANALELTDAAKLVRLRGQLMQQAVPEGIGAMAAVLNADLELIEAACRDAAQGEVIAPANLNAPGQIVISGHASALERTLILLAERGARKAIRLPVSVPSHCELMRGAAEQLRAALAQIELRAPEIPVLHNVSAAAQSDPQQIREKLVAQLYSRVRWIESVQALVAQGVTSAYECGPGKALSGMVKRISDQLSCAPLAEPSEFKAALEASQ